MQVTTAWPRLRRPEETMMRCKRVIRCFIDIRANRATTHLEMGGAHPLVNSLPKSFGVGPDFPV